MRQEVQEADIQMESHELLQVFEGGNPRKVPGKRLLDSTANICGTIQQGSVNIEKVYRKRRYPCVPRIQLS